jgi:hypothetical protein
MKIKDEGLRKKYRQNNPTCELRPVMIAAGYDFARKWPIAAAAVHHIAHAGGRWDRTTNFIALSNEAHLWCHENSDPGKVFCFFVKARKGELSAGELRPIVGREFGLWLGQRVNGLGSTFLAVRDRLLEELAKGMHQ